MEPLNVSDLDAIAIMDTEDPPRRLTPDQAAAVANVFDDIYAARAESRTDCPSTLPDAA